MQSHLTYWYIKMCVLMRHIFCESLVMLSVPCQTQTHIFIAANLPEKTVLKIKNPSCRGSTRIIYCTFSKNKLVYATDYNRQTFPIFVWFVLIYGPFKIFFLEVAKIAEHRFIWKVNKKFHRKLNFFSNVSCVKSKTRIFLCIKWQKIFGCTSTQM